MDQSVMTRFLNSIDIHNIEDFDMSFDLFSRSIIDKNSWDIVINKSTPWNYSLLNEFIEKLHNIKYKYTLKFLYDEEITGDDVITLFEQWYQYSFHLHCPFTCSFDQNIVTFSFTSEKEKKDYANVIESFKSLLNMITYSFRCKTEVLKTTKVTIVKKPKAESVETCTDEKCEHADIVLDDIEESKKEAPIKDVFDVLDKDNAEDSEEEIKEFDADKEKDEIMSMVEDQMLEEMKANLEKMKREREIMRRNKKGNYTYVKSIDEIDSNSGNVDFNGQIFSIESKSTPRGFRLTIGVADEMSGAIFCEFYNSKSLNDEKAKSLKEKTNVRVRGCAFINEFSRQLTIKGHYIDILPPDELPTDNVEKARVELHLHTQMSAMDAPGEIKEYCALAKSYGMTAIAITDHDVVSGYPDAQKAAKKNGLKMLYGTEISVVEDQLPFIKNPAEIPLNRANYVVLDLETTGLSCRYNRIIEFGGVRIENGVEVKRLDILIDPLCDVPEHITKITQITNEMVKGQPTFAQVKDRIKDFCKDAILVTHNAEFDIPFLNERLVAHGDEPLPNPVIDTLSLSYYTQPNLRSHRLGMICKAYEVMYDAESAHRADYDAQVLNECWQAMLAAFIKENPKIRHKDLGLIKPSLESFKHIHPFHMTILVKNLEGLKRLYEIISLSHVDYLVRNPQIIRSEVEKRHDGLLFGSACFNGEVFEVASHKNYKTLLDTVSRYDYIEIQPLANYVYLVNSGSFTSMDEIETIVRDIVRAADECHIPVVATSDCHYVLPSQKIVRDVYISAKGLGGVAHPLNLNPYDREDGPKGESPDQHFRSTTEMLEEMAFLGEEKAYEVTVTNTNMIADSLDPIVPLPNNVLYAPTIDNVEEKLTNLCYGNAKKIYGDPIPEKVKNRLDTELNGIISNGFAVIYYIAYELVKKANEDGYLVGSRGSVGSSFAATMADITEVNPLPPHYVCTNCHHLEWTSETYPDITSGYDLPEKVCPVCGKPMLHDGQNIPFETFLGFHAEKTPDIDLNFPGDYQARAHDYTKVLLGPDKVFRAGTIETVKDKTAFGYVRGYFERMGINPDEVSRAKIAYLASKCTGVRRTTGQHPGGIVVVPKAYKITDFMPVQFPANKRDNSWKTTHFDYHAFDETLLKLDMLGHVDPVALRLMAELTKIDIKSIPLNDKKVLSLFSDTSALGLRRNYLKQNNGGLAIPEFGTSFVRGLLDSTKPKTFSDLVIISGLSHGTDVWNGNAEKLIEENITDLRGVIGCRDDIMTYLISMGVPPSLSFQIMEDVRHGKVLKPEQEEVMRKNNVPEYYIESCNKIQYLFPKGHATAYVMMAIRVGYFKVYYPLEFYAVFFSVRSDQWDIEAMIKGEDAIIARYEELAKRQHSRTDKLNPKEEAILKTLIVAIEMVDRGYSFSNLDLYRSDAANFVVDHERNSLIPPFAVIDGLGENAAASVIEARKNGEFTSKEDLLRRTKLNGTNVAKLTDLGVLDGLSDSDQLSLFDFDF